MRTYYDILEVSPNASEEVIRGAYKYLIQKWHPDKNLGNAAEATQRTNDINEAYSVLSNRDLRNSYDSWLRERSRNEQHESPEQKVNENYHEEPLVPQLDPTLSFAMMGHRLTVILFIAFLLCAIFFSSAMSSGLGVAFIIAFAILAFALARALQKDAWVWGLFSLIPLVNWALITILLYQVSKLFNWHGYKQRFFGGAEQSHLSSDALLATPMWQRLLLGNLPTFTISLLAIALGVLLSLAALGRMAGESAVKELQATRPNNYQTATTPTPAMTERVGTTIAQQNRQFDRMLDELEYRIPQVNPKSSSYNHNVVLRLESRVDFYERQGQPAPRALQSAASDVTGVRLNIPPPN